MTDTAHLFPSDEWVDAFCANLEQHPEGARTAQALAGVHRLEVRPAGPLSDHHRYDVRVTGESDGGESDGHSVTRLHQLVDRPRLSLSADYVRWRQLLEGRLDVKVAVLLGRLRVSGDLAGVRSNLDETRPLLDALSSVTTRWRD